MSRLKIAAATVLGLAVLAGGAVGVYEINFYADRDRAMYHDTLLMAGLQYDLLKEGKPGVELSVDSSSGPVLVGDVSFETNDGVSIVVEERDGDYCVQGHNEHGSETLWECVDGTGTRPELGALEGEDFDNP